MKVLMCESQMPENWYSFDLSKELNQYVDLTLLCKRDVPPLDLSLIHISEPTRR